MATTVNEEKKVTLIDGTEVFVRPLKISLLRAFMKKFEGIAEISDNNDKSMTLLMECVQIAMKQYKPELAEDLKKLEDNIDLPTVYRIVEEASGINMSGLSGIIPNNA
jgi:inhibitor of KinA sporulation pathway (predicted exonuclease)